MSDLPKFEDFRAGVWSVVLYTAREAAFFIINFMHHILSNRFMSILTKIRDFLNLIFIE